MNIPSPDPSKPGSGFNPAPTLPGGATSLPHTVGWAPDPKEPTAFGRYQLMRLLGKGGMGSVYLARDTQLDRPVAVKIPTLHGSSPELIERFYREARAAATLHHPNLCPVFDIGDVDGIPFLTMAYIEGQPLAGMVKEGQPMPPEQATRIVRLTALALQVAHEKGVVHRDLKPANIMITPKGEPVVMDFGLALKALDTEEVRLTQTGMILGTLAYMSPEQVNGHRSIGPASDVYSLGVVLYELLCGKIPFDGPPGQLMARTAFEQPAPPSRHKPTLPAALDVICLKALAKRPEERFKSMADFARALETTGPSAVAPTLLTTAPAPLPPRQRGSSGWLIVVGLLLVLVGFFAGAGVPLLRWMGADEAADRLEQGPMAWLSRLWPGSATKETPPEQLFPQEVRGYRLVTQDRNANCPDVNIRASGWRAIYAGPDQFEVFVYHISESQMRSMLKRAYDKLGGARNVRGEPKATPMAYATGTGGSRTYGLFYFNRGFLFHVRGKQDPAKFLEAYVHSIGRGQD